MAKSSAKRRAASRPATPQKPAKRSPKPPARSPDEAFAWLAAQAWTRRAAAVQAEVDRACESPVWGRLGVEPSRDPATFERQLAVALRGINLGREPVDSIAEAMAALEKAVKQSRAGGGESRLKPEELRRREAIFKAWKSFKKDEVDEPLELGCNKRKGSREHFAAWYADTDAGEGESPADILDRLMAHQKHRARSRKPAGAKAKGRGKHPR